MCGPTLGQPNTFLAPGRELLGVDVDGAAAELVAARSQRHTGSHGPFQSHLDTPYYILLVIIHTK
jgi:hypothetical protein